MPDPKKPKTKAAPTPATEPTPEADATVNGVATAEPVAAPPPKKTRPKKAAPEGREVRYPEVELLDCSGPNALTADLMKQLVGWEIVPEGAGPDAEFLYTDCQGNKVRFRDNIGNRPFDVATMKKYKQVILHKHWCGPNGNGKTVNGEAAIIGRTGLVISLQHRAAALIDAALEWTVTDPDSDRGKELRSAWESEPVMDTVVVRGVDESAETTRTIDDVRASTLDDVLYKEGDVFKRDKGDVRRAKCKLLSFAIRCLWDRTGVSDDAYNPGLKMTHTDAMAYFDEHPKLEHCVTHVHKEWEGQKGDELFLPKGMACGLMYLMAASGTEKPEKYLDHEVRSERRLDMSRMPQAEEFIVQLASDAHKNPDNQWVGFRAAFASAEDNSTGLGGTRDEKAAIVSNAWAKRQAGELWKRSGSNLVPEYVTETVKNEDTGEDVLQIVALQTPYPTVGGVDIGPATGRVKPEKDDNTGDGEGDDETDAEPADKPRELTREEQLGKLRKEHKGKVLIFQAGKGLAFYGKDIDAVVKAGVNLGANKTIGTLTVSTYPAVKLQEVLDALHAEMRSAVVISETGETVAHDAPQ